MARQLAASGAQHCGKNAGSINLLPPPGALDSLMQHFRTILFAALYAPHQHHSAPGLHTRQAELEHAYALLCRHIEASLAVGSEDGSPPSQQEVEDVATRLLTALPDIQALLYSDVDAVMKNDPATRSPIEVICCYPAITVMLHYRIAHALHGLELPLLPRMITERAHSLTGIDIHPAAQIGHSFGIDHGTGIVIGQTTIIGNEVIIYQRVTLGARNFVRDKAGNLLNRPRHPVIEDHVTIYSNTSILGRVRIGHDSIIGGNLWITDDVLPHSRIRQSKPEAHFGYNDGAGI